MKLEDITFKEKIEYSKTVEVRLYTEFNIQKRKEAEYITN